MGIATASDPALVVAGVYGAHPHLAAHPDLRRGSALGASDGRAAWRGELLAHFLLNPTRRRGVGVYGAGGVAVVGGPVDQGYLVLTLGLEARPGGALGLVRRGRRGRRGAAGGGLRWRRLATGLAGLLKTNRPGAGTCTGAIA